MIQYTSVFYNLRGVESDYSLKYGEKYVYLVNTPITQIALLYIPFTAVFKGLSTRTLVLYELFKAITHLTDAVNVWFVV